MESKASSVTRLDDREIPIKLGLGTFIGVLLLNLGLSLLIGTILGIIFSSF